MKKVNGQVAVIDDLVSMACGVGFEDVKDYHYHSGYAPQPVKMGKMRLGR